MAAPVQRAVTQFRSARLHSLARGWSRWRSISAHDERVQAAASRVLRRIIMTKLAAGLDTWRAAVAQCVRINRRGRLARGFVHRLRSKTLAMAWRTWMLCVAIPRPDMQHASTTMRQAIGRLICRALARSFSSWWRGTLSVRSDEQHHLHLVNSSLRRACVFLQVGHWRAVAHAWVHWRSIQAHHERLHKAVARVMLRTLVNEIAIALHAWRLAAGIYREPSNIQKLACRMLRSILCKKLAFAWRTWCTQRRAQLTRQLSTCTEPNRATLRCASALIVARLLCFRDEQRCYNAWRALLACDRTGLGLTSPLLQTNRLAPPPPLPPPRLASQRSASVSSRASAPSERLRRRSRRMSNESAGHARKAAQVALILEHARPALPGHRSTQQRQRPVISRDDATAIPKLEDTLTLSFDALQFLRDDSRAGKVVELGGRKMAMRLICRLIRSVLVRGFTTWYSNVLKWKQAIVTALQHACAYFRSSHLRLLAQAWSFWRDVLRNSERAERLIERVVRGMLFIRLASGFKSWRTAIDACKSIEHSGSAVHRVLRRMQSRRFATVWRTWLSHIEHLELSRTHRRKQLTMITRNACARIANEGFHALTCAWSQWRDVLRNSERADSLVERVVRRMLFIRLASGFKSWRNAIDACKSIEHSGSAVHRVLRRMQSRRFATVWRTWLSPHRTFGAVADASTETAHDDHEECVRADCERGFSRAHARLVAVA